METFTLAAADGVSIFVRHWQTVAKPRGALQIVHGMAEHGGRYGELAQALTAAGYAVYAQDLRGHGGTAARMDELGYFGEGKGWRTCLDDVGLVQRRMANDFPGTPVFLFGHSMGSFLAQHFAGEKGDALAGLVLSGCYLESPGMAGAGAILARLERFRLGPRGRSSLIRMLTFDAFNRRLAPTRTAFDWLSRDTSEVDQYMADPLCGFEPSVQLWIELLGALADGLPIPSARLPVCIMDGECDPVCAPDPSATRLVDDFRRAGIDRLAHCIYPDARHELFHETNRAEVTTDLITWLDQFAGADRA